MKDRESTNLPVLLKSYRTKLLPYAYNIVGDTMEAEDIVQEVLNKYVLMPGDHIEKPESYLIRAVINRSINQKKLLRSQKERYPGKWLPVPVFTEEGIYAEIDRRRILNYSLMVLLENLTVKERAVFILKETFEYSHNEIGNILNIRADNSRQLFRRGKEKLAGNSFKENETLTGSTAILEDLTNAILERDMEGVKQLLHDEVQVISDGGPKQTAARNVITGHERVYKLLKAIYGKYMPGGATTSFTVINFNPAVLYMIDGMVFRTLIFEIRERIIHKVYIMVNPDKLRSLNNFN